MLKRSTLQHSTGSILLCGPAIALYTAFFVLPTLLGFTYGLTNWSGWSKDPRYIGLDNFRELIADDRFFATLQFTLFETAMIVVGYTVLSLVLAVLLDRMQVMKGLVRGLFFYPFILSILVSALLFQYMANYRTGAINTLLRSMGLDSLTQDWMGDPALVPYFILALVLWHGLGFYTTIYLAGLQTIPGEQYEAAEIDGASPWAVFRHIQIPSLIPQIKTNSVIALITGINLFPQILVTTQGGPGYRTFTTGYYIYWLGSENDRQGYASAIAFVVFVLLVLVAAIQATLLQRRETEL